MSRCIPTGGEPDRSPSRLDLDLVIRLPAPLPAERSARMVEQRLVSWHPTDAVAACEQALAAWLRPPLAPLAIAHRIDGGRR